jgi:hypothetical protein
MKFYGNWSPFAPCCFIEIWGNLFWGCTKQPFCFLERGAPAIAYVDVGRGEKKGTVCLILHRDQVLPLPVLNIPMVLEPPKPQGSTDFFNVFNP